MASIAKPDWWDVWVIQGLYGTQLREGAPKDVQRAYRRFLADLAIYKV